MGCFRTFKIRFQLLSSAREHLPDATPFIHFESTDYYTPDGRDYPMPHNNIYIQVNGLVFDFDFETIVWFHKMFIDAADTIQKGNFFRILKLFGVSVFFGDSILFGVLIIFGWWFDSKLFLMEQFFVHLTISRTFRLIKIPIHRKTSIPRNY